MAIQKYEADTFSKFVELTDSFDLIAGDVVFRGQLKRRNLLPSIARNNPEKDTTREEQEMMGQMQLIGASHLVAVKENELDLLVIAQHHGMKTRLLDWSGSPLAALWFACSEIGAGDAYVYALEKRGELVDKDVYSKSPFKTEATGIFQPRLNNSRIIAQQGWFTLHRYSQSSKCFVALENNPRINAGLHEIKVPAKSRSGMLDSLNRHGIGQHTLFPDLEGICKHLNWRHNLTNA